MKLKQLESLLEANPCAALHVTLPSGEFVPAHFHVTEVGRIHKVFIDCGGTRRDDVICSLQVWTANDKDHRLTAAKLSKILKLGRSVVGDDDLSVEVEYGADVVSVFKLANVEQTPSGLLFVLAGKKTDCLAPDKCGVSQCSTSGCC